MLKKMSLDIRASKYCVTKRKNNYVRVTDTDRVSQQVIFFLLFCLICVRIHSFKRSLVRAFWLFYFLITSKLNKSCGCRRFHQLMVFDYLKTEVFSVVFLPDDSRTRVFDCWFSQTSCSAVGFLSRGRRCHTVSTVTCCCKVPCGLGVYCSTLFSEREDLETNSRQWRVSFVQWGHFVVSNGAALIWGHVHQSVPCLKTDLSYMVTPPCPSPVSLPPPASPPHSRPSICKSSPGVKVKKYRLFRNRVEDVSVCVCVCSLCSHDAPCWACSL